jgi:TRAP-type C4-dicarboxylate transport system permease small subunit
MKLLLKLEYKLQWVLMAVAAIFLMGMTAITCADILIRQVWKPLPGVFELMGFFGAMVVACSLGYTQQKRDHIAVDILTKMMPVKVQFVLDFLNRLACMAFSILAAWQVWVLASGIRQSGEVSETLRMIYYPFTYGVAAGFVMLAVVFFVELAKVIRPVEES